MVFSIKELLDMVIMTAAVGYIFMTLLRVRMRRGHPYMEPGFDWNAFKMAMWMVGPALLLHELAHKFVALGFGFQATFNAAYFFLILGIIMMKLFGFVFFVPAYVAIGCNGFQCTIPPIQHALIAVAGPGINLVLFLGSWIALKFYSAKFSRRTQVILHMTKIINLFLFIFNMIPIPGFDGSKVLAGLLAAF